MRVGIVGSGFAGLAAAHLLARRPGVSLTVLEREDRYGGRAAVTDGAEHCSRFFVGDYAYVFAMLREIPLDSGSVADVIEPVRRFARVPSGAWVEIGHVYASRARELSVADRWAAARATRASLLVARRSPHTDNAFGSGANYSVRTVLRMAQNIGASRSAFAVPGSTERLVIAPWVRFLTTQGVAFRAGIVVQRLYIDDDHVEVVTDQGSESFDSVIVTTFVHDAYQLLDRCEIPRPLDWRRHAHCKCFTLELDPRETVLRDRSLRTFTSPGLLLLLQPAAQRCVVLTTTAKSTAERYVVDRVRETLGLDHPLVRVSARDNLAAADGVFAGECVDPGVLEDAVARTHGGRRRVFFAGSYTSNSYPVDSAESACRSALAVVARLAEQRADDGLARLCDEWRRGRGLPVPGGAGASRRSRRHPNTMPRGSGLLWHLVRAVGFLATAPVVRLSVMDLSRSALPHAAPIVYVGRSRFNHDGLTRLLTCAQLGARPRLVLPERLFAGFPGKALQLVGALPWISGSAATRVAMTAALEAGESIAVGVQAPTGDVDDLFPFDAATVTGTRIVPVGSWGSLRPRPRRRFVVPRARVVVVAGEPIHPEGAPADELAVTVNRHIEALDLLARDRATSSRRDGGHAGATPDPAHVIPLQHATGRFAYENLNDRAPTAFVRLSRAVVPGVHRVAAQIGPYAAYWQAANMAALQRDGPLWVVLGDSLGQGIGATRVELGWVPRCAARLRAHEIDHRIVNLSFSGARVGDVIERQLPALAALAEPPGLVTVLVGANDLLRREFRIRLASRFRELLAALPDGSFVAAMPGAPYGLRPLGRILAAEPASRGLVPVPVHVPLPFGTYLRAADLYHPSDDAYAAIARAFSHAIITRLGDVRPAPAAPELPTRRRPRTRRPRARAGSS